MSQSSESVVRWARTHLEFASRVTDADHDVRVPISVLRARCLIESEAQRGRETVPLVEEVLLDGREDVLLGESFVHAPILMELVEGEVAVLVERETRDEVMVSSHACDSHGDRLGSPYFGFPPLPLRAWSFRAA